MINVIDFRNEDFDKNLLFFVNVEKEMGLGAKDISEHTDNFGYTAKVFCADECINAVKDKVINSYIDLFFGNGFATRPDENYTYYPPFKLDNVVYAVRHAFITDKMVEVAVIPLTNGEIQFSIDNFFDDF